MKNILCLLFLALFSSASNLPAEKNYNLEVTSEELVNATSCVLKKVRGVPFKPSSWAYSQYFSIQCDNGFQKRTEVSYFNMKSTSQNYEKFILKMLAMGFHFANSVDDVIFSGSAFNPKTEYFTTLIRN